MSCGQTPAGADRAIMRRNPAWFCRCGLPSSQVGEKGFNFGKAHVSRVDIPLIRYVEEDVAFDPRQAGFFGVECIVFRANGIATLLRSFLGSFLLI